MTEQVFEKIKEKNLIRDGDIVIAGVSGGADSVCLFLILKELQNRMTFTLRVVHVEHGIRGDDSKKDAEFVENLCREFHTDCTVYHENIPEYAKKNGMGLEEAARIRRYLCYERSAEALEKSGTEAGRIRIALAHHAEDNAETILFQMVRGSGLDGVCGMDYERQWKAYHIIRPLLGVERAEIEAYLAGRGQIYCTDSTNADVDYSRNRIRHRVLPELKNINEQAVSHINQTAEILTGLKDYMEQEVKRVRKLETRNREDGILLQSGLWKEYPEIIQKEVIHEAIGEVAGSRKDVTAVHVALVQKLFYSQNGRQVDLPYQIGADRVYEGVLLRRRQEREKEQATFLMELSKEQIAAACEKSEAVFEVPGGTVAFKMIEFSGKVGEIHKKTYTKWFDYDKIKRGLQIRTRRAGDYLTVDEAGHTKRLKEYFINEKIPVDKRDQILLVTEDSHVLWVMGKRISAGYKVSESTKRILEVHFSSQNKEGIL